MGAKIIMEKIFDRNSTVKEAKNYKPFAEAVEHIEWGKDEEDTLEESNNENIPILSSPLQTFEITGQLYKLLHP